MKNVKVRAFTASVDYSDTERGAIEESFPVYAPDYPAAKDIALSYILQVLKLQDFEMRIVGA